MWVKMEEDLLENPKFWKLCRVTGWDEDQGIGKLYRLWRFTYRYAEDGNLSQFNPQDLARAINSTEENLQHLIEVGFIDREPYLRIHDWHQYALQFLSKKYSGTDNEDIPKRIKRVYKSKRFNSTVPVLNQDCFSPLDLSRDVRSETTSRNSRNTAVKTLPARTKSENDTASPPEPSPGNGNGAPGNGAGPQDERAEVIEFIRKYSPPDPQFQPNFADEKNGLTLNLAVRHYSPPGVMAAWKIYTSSAFAEKFHFAIWEFLRELPYIVENHRDEFVRLRRQIQDETRRVAVA